MTDFAKYQALGNDYLAIDPNLVAGLGPTGVTLTGGVEEVMAGVFAAPPRATLGLSSRRVLGAPVGPGVSR